MQRDVVFILMFLDCSLRIMRGDGDLCSESLMDREESGCAIELNLYANDCFFFKTKINIFPILASMVKESSHCVGVLDMAAQPHLFVLSAALPRCSQPAISRPLSRGSVKQPLLGSFIWNADRCEHLFDTPHTLFLAQHSNLVTQGGGDAAICQNYVSFETEG